MSDKGAFVEHGLTLEAPRKHPGGRPRVTADPDEVRRLRDLGASWRRIARTLDVGTATAMRLYSGPRAAPEASQNSPQGTTDARPQ